MATALLKYLDNDRHYHTFTHIGDMLSDLEDFFPEHRDNMVLKYAIAYHDCIYDATSKDNEWDSGDAASKELYELLDSAHMVQVEELIMVTKDHVPNDDPLSKIIIDLDLSGLSSLLYKGNSDKIRKEYSMFTDREWREGRIAFLNKFLNRKVYQTEQFANLEKLAKLNMERELDYLLGL